MSEAGRVHEALRTTFERLCKVDAEARYERRGAYDLFVFPRIPVPQFNSVWPLDDSAVPDLERALGEIAELGLPGSVQVRPRTTPAVVDEATRLGLTEEHPLPALAVRPSELSATQPPELAVGPVEDEDGLRDAMATAVAGFETPPDFFAPLYTADMAALEGLTYYVARVDGVAAATSAGFTVDGSVGIFSVATAPEHRGRGYGAAVTAAAARDAFANGADLAWLQSSAMGLSIYRRIGFREVESYVLLTP